MSNNKDKLREWKSKQPPIVIVVPDRKRMVAALKSDVVPLIRKCGFSGSFPHFRRIRPIKTDCLCFQFDRYGGGFVVEIGEGPTEDLVLPQGEKNPVTELTVPYLDLARRARLASGPRPQGDQWFRYDTGNDEAFDLAAKAVQTLLPQVEAWFRGERSLHNVQSFFEEE